jgi:hypothetical protein
MDVERGLDAPTGVQPLFGATYLKRNRDRLLSHIHEARSGYQGQAIHQGSIGWLAPDYGLWGRGEDFRQSVEAFRKALRTTGKGDDLFVLDRAEERQESSVRGKYTNTGLVELHLFRPSVVANSNWHSSLEVLLYPGRFAAVLLHAPLSTIPGARVPFGFVSTLPKHLRLAHQLMLDSANGNRYGGRWSPNREGGPGRSQTLFEACSFLAYSDIQLRSTV